MERRPRSRFGWFGGGCFVGVIAGVLCTLLASMLAVTQVPPVATIADSDSSLSTAIDEDYLNREISKRLNGNYSLGLENITLKGASLDFKPDNAVDLKPTFGVEVGPLKFDVTATVRNQLFARDGKLAMEMAADPKLGNLDVPLSKLPFDLNAQIKEASNRMNNDLILIELNERLETGFDGTSFAVADVKTDENGITIVLQDK